MPRSAAATRRADDERGHAGEARGDGVGEGVAVERGDVGGAEVDEGENDDAVLVSGGGGAGLAETLGEHGEDAGGGVGGKGKFIVF